MNQTERPKGPESQAVAEQSGPEVSRRLRKKRDWFKAQLEKLFGEQPQEEGPQAELENKLAHQYLTQYLQENVEASEVIMDMGDIIDEFRKRAPRLIVVKCIDGRVHGSKGKGYPPTTVDFFRTEGSELTTDIGNMAFWKRMDGVSTDAARNTPDIPALFIALAHTAHEGHGCAAQSVDGEGNPLPHDVVIQNSLATVEAHAKMVQSQYSPDQIYAMHGMTNTDDMSECLYFADGTVLDTSEIITNITGLGINLENPEDVFESDFLSNAIPDAAIRSHTGSIPVGELMRGDAAPMYRDLETGIAMEAFLLREISSMASSGKNTIINPVIFNAVLSKLTKSTKNKPNGLPEALVGPLLYQTIWNIAYTLYQRNRLKGMDEKEKEEHLEHAETLVCYGEGFEILPRNKAILAKTGRGDDRKALRTAKKVLDKNRTKHPQEHQPIVHVNVEVTGELDKWGAFNTQVLARLAAMTREVYDVFGDDVRIMTTYSKKDEKRFYPVQTYPESEKRPRDKRLSFPVDISTGLKADPSFADELKRREKEYSEFLSSAA